jgi:hypothetical protein
MSTLVLAIAEAGLGDGDIPAHVGSHGIVRGMRTRQDDRFDSIRYHRLGSARPHASAQHDATVTQQIKDARMTLRSLLVLAAVITDSLVVRCIGIGAEFPVLHGQTVYFEHHKSLALAKMLR